MSTSKADRSSDGPPGRVAVMTQHHSTTEPRTMDYGTLRASTDSWLLVRDDVRLLHIPFDFDTSIEGAMVSVIGRMGRPEGSPHTKLIVEKMALHDDIAAHAHGIHKAGHGGSAEENWLRAERELLGI